ncbi:hypothetical protein F3Y22_tig00110987pilonHSYRG00361 [Hibiscus syriacus]|uniref:DUF7745 domain-containing protein n=1 Tax=Hibiscus syriacus TaxID=106335 RepID=A0A6A2Z8X6_HIBSY|nr:hypothetical protein F3Y22_tig00110987pilonHSYRG00361 [Hibiscus syriacus]
MDKGVVIQEIKNAEARLWSEKTQKEKGYSLQGNYVSELVSYASVSLKQNDVQELRNIWESWGNDRKQKFSQRYGNGEGIEWIHIRQLMKNHPDEWKTIDLFALGLYGLVIFMKTLGCIDTAVVELFEQLPRRVNPAPAILAETFRSLNHCRRTGGGRIGILPGEPPGCSSVTFFFWYGDSDTMTLLGLWGTVGYKKSIKEAADSWKKVYRMDVVAARDILTQDYVEWRRLRKNDNIPVPECEDTRTMEEHLRHVPSELEIAKAEFEAVNNELKQKKDRADKLEREHKRARFELEDLRKGYKDKVKDNSKLKVTSEYWKDEFHSLKRKFEGSDERAWKEQLKTTQRRLVDSHHQNQCLRIQMADLEKQHGKTISELEVIVDGFKKQTTELQIVPFDGGMQWRFRWEQAQQRVKARDVVIRDFLDQVKKAVRHLHGLAREAGMVRQGIQPMTDEGRRFVNLLEVVRGLEDLVRTYL